MTQQLHWLPFTTCIESKVSFLIRNINVVMLLNTFAITSDPLSLLPISDVSALPNAMIFSCLVLGETWPSLGPLLLLVRHSGITSLLLFVRLFCLLHFPRLSRLNSYLFLELKCTESASVWITP